MRFIEEIEKVTSLYPITARFLKASFQVIYKCLKRGNTAQKSTSCQFCFVQGNYNTVCLSFDTLFSCYRQLYQMAVICRNWHTTLFLLLYQKGGLSWYLQAALLSPIATKQILTDYNKNSARID